MEITQANHAVDEVQHFAAEINAELDRCDNGEGMECASLDASLDHYAIRCSRFTERIRQWGRDVFAGKSPADAAVSEAWFNAGVQLNNRSVEMLERASQMEVPCYELPGANRLAAAVFALHQIVSAWEDPRLSVGPAARRSDQLASHAEDARLRMSSLIPLPKDWLPADSRQQAVFKKVSRA